MRSKAESLRLVYLQLKVWVVSQVISEGLLGFDLVRVHLLITLIGQTSSLGRHNTVLCCVGAQPVVNESLRRLRLLLIGGFEVVVHDRVLLFYLAVFIATVRRHLLLVLVHRSRLLIVGHLSVILLVHLLKQVRYFVH